MEERVLKNEINDMEYQALMEGLEKSKFEKALILPLIQEDTEDILEVGCGNGVVLSLLANNFPNSTITGLDIDPVMCQASLERNLPRVNVVEGGATSIPLPSESADAVVFCSTLHEVYSHGNSKDVRDTLGEAYRVLRQGGSVIIRDSVKPPDGQVTLRFKRDWVKNRFYRFLKDYRLVDAQMKKSSTGVRINSAFCFEFLTKYFYEVGWHKELEEVYGYYTEQQFISELQNTGFNVEYNHCYLIPYFREKWMNDVELDRSLPLSTIILKATKKS